MGEDGKGGRGENKWYAGREKRGMGEDGKGGRGEGRYPKKKKKTKCTKAIGIAGLLTINDVCHSLHL